MLNRLFDKYFYPTILISNLILYIYLLNYLDIIYLVPGLLLTSLIVIRIFEIKKPKIQKWNLLRYEYVVDILHTLITKIGIKEFLNILLYSVLVNLGSTIKSTYHITLFPNNINIFLQVLICLLIVEFIGYWLHRLAHKHKFLWKLHEVHHSSNKMWVLNVSRAHPLDVFYRLILPFMILIIIGIEGKTMGLYLVVSSTIAFLQHSNLKLETKYLNYIFATPKIHHWHHSVDIDRAQCNFGHVLIIYDWLFGTFYLPKGEISECEEVGVSNTKVPVDFVGQMIYPFKRK